LTDSRSVLVLLGIVLAVPAWSGIGPLDRWSWCLEAAPVPLGIAILAATYRRFPLTRLTYSLLAVHAVILMIGGHYR